MSISEVISASTSAFADDPGAAAARVTASGHLDGPDVRVQLRAGRHEVVVDEPEALGGQDAGASPVQHALLALASCQAITYRFWATELGIALDDVEVDVEADIDLRGFFGVDDAVRPGFGEVRVSATPKGPESAERYRELAEAVDAHCPVLDLFSNATPVRTRLAVEA